MRAQQKIVASKLKSYIGQRLKVILIAPADSKNTWRARTEFQAPHIDGETFVVNVGKNAVSGDFVDVIVTDFDEYDLIAEVAK
jgi:ribosomal protein S12 methylthiotransferase